MSSDKDSFEDRLRRISQSRAETAAVSGPDQRRIPGPARSSGSMPKGMMVYMIIGLLCLGAVAVITAKISALPNTALREVMANLQGADVEPTEPGFIDQLAAKIFPSNIDQSRAPIHFLPAAPDGWVRVTPDDAAMPNALDAIKARWPQGHGVLPLEQNLGYKQLTLYLDLRREPDVEQTVLAKTGTTALYLNGNGEFLTMRLDILSERGALGTTNDPASWIEGLAAIEETALASGEILERLHLGGLEVTNQTKPVGKSQIARPIGSDIYAGNGLKIAAPLTNRAVLRLQGIATPIIAQTLITSIDRDALSVLHK